MNKWNLTDEKCEALAAIYAEEDEKLALLGVKPTYYREEPSDTYADPDEETFL